MSEGVSKSARSDVLTKPSGQIGLTQLATGKGEDESDDLFFGGLDTKAIQSEEEIHRLEGDTLVSIDERVILGETESVCRGQGGEIGV